MSSSPTHADGHNTGAMKLPVNECFACGADNPDGMKLRFVLDEASRQAVCEFELPKRFQGPPGHAHGGIIATILDEAMGKVNKFRGVVAFTKSMDIRYLKPVPLHTQLRAVGYERQVEGREHHNSAEIRNLAGEVLATSEGVFIAMDLDRIKAKLNL
jgi:uncharacterized protein (TIGR00369 family)